MSLLNISVIGSVQLKVEESGKCRKYQVELAPGKACQHLSEHASSCGYKDNLLQAQKIPLEEVPFLVLGLPRKIWYVYVQMYERSFCSLAIYI